MKTTQKIKSAVKRAIKKITTKTIDLPAKERLKLFDEEYRALVKKYNVDFTVMSIDLNRIYQEGGVNKLRPEELPVIE